MDQHSEASDLLYGVPAIAAFLGMGEKQVRHRTEAGIIPTFKMPGTRTVCARRSTLTTWLAGLEAAATTAPTEEEPSHD